ncbi:hypothetical protein JCGZ_21822 [Jatropha curcas]|uniref:Pentacotripeptide-repeat region of PRORP domain-containing protein n=1 Tax=Jatropha curcas TaxID=180498 RepID=A0A067JBY3_JATCU|nr:hypothetical protein JCGZ_21822 [Jatropha curcas]
MGDRDVQPNVVTLSVLINALCREGKIKEANGLFELMVQSGVETDIYTCSVLTNGYCKNWKVHEAMRFYRDMMAKGIQPNVIIHNILLNGLFRSVKLRTREIYFGRCSFMTTMRYHQIQLLKILTFMDLCRTENISAALKLLGEMVNGNGESGMICKPDRISYAGIIDGLCKDGLIEKAKELFKQMKDMGIFPDVVVYTSLLQGVCSHGEWEDAHLSRWWIGVCNIMTLHLMC